MAREERKERITRQREEQILTAALEVFAEKGFGAATVPDIAGKAGLAVGSIYNYFPNKRELFVAVIRNLILNTPLMELIDTIPGGNIPDIFVRIMKNRLVLLDTMDMYHIPFLMSEIQRDPELKELWYQEMLKPFLSKLEGMYGGLVANDGDDERPAITVRMIGGFILGFLMMKILEGEHSPVNRIPEEKISRYMMEFLINGVGFDDKNTKGKRTE